MSSLDFSLILFDKIFLYLIVLFLLLPVYIAIISKKSLGILDPITYLLIGSAFAASTAIFTFIVDQSSTKYLFSFLSTEICFLIGFTLAAPNKLSLERDCIKRGIHDKYYLNSKFFLIILGFFFFTLKGFQFTVIGIPLFEYNRLNMASAGFGIFQTLSSALLPLLCFRIVLQLINRKSSNAIAYFFLALLFITAILDGSKAGMLVLAQMFFLSYFLLNGNKNFVKINSYQNNQLNLKLKFALSGIIIVPILANVFTKFDDPTVGILGIVYRMVAFGDIFYQAYPNNSIEVLNQFGSLKQLFYPLITTFKIASPDALHYSIGEILNQSVENSFEGGGANARLNIVSYLMFGNLGFVFSFIVGLLLGYLRRLLLVNTVNFFKKIYIYIAVLSCSFLWNDLYLGIVVVVLLYLTATFWIFFEKMIILIKSRSIPLKNGVL